MHALLCCHLCRRCVKHAGRDMNVYIRKHHKGGKLVDKEVGQKLFYRICRAETRAECDSLMTRFRSEYPHGAQWIEQLGENQVS